MLAETLRNTAPYARIGRFVVIEEAQLIELRHQAGTFTLHEVLENGHDRMFLRAVKVSADTLVVFDLRDICPVLQEIAHHHHHDVPGLVLYTLRAVFATVPEALAAIALRPLAAGQRFEEVH